MLKKVWTDPVWSKVIAGIILALLAIIARYLAGSWSSTPSLVLNLVSRDIPLWSLLVGVALAFMLGLLAGRKQWRKRWTRGAEEEITFTYLPESPILHGWTAVDKSTLPDFKLLVDGVEGKTLRIDPRGPKERYALDYGLQAVSRVRRVTVIGKWTSGSWVYLRVRLVSTSGENSITGWIQLDAAITEPRLIGDQSKISYEWSWPINLIPENGWQRGTVDVEQAVAKTFGLSGWKYAQLEGFRVRGPIHLARIRLENAR